VIVAFAGRRVDPPDTAQPRFPLWNAEMVTQRLRTVVALLKPSAFVGSAACGADLLALDVARSLGCRRRIVLPCEAKQFREFSVADCGGNWGAMFDALVQDARGENDLVLIPYSADWSASIKAANARIIAEALALAREAESIQNQITALIAWDGQPHSEDDFTQDFIDQVRAHDIPIVTINTLHPMGYTGGTTDGCA